MIVSFIIFSLFVWGFVYYNGIPQSISDMVYDLNPAVFTLGLWGFAIPAMFYDVYMFAAGGFVCFVGVARDFKSERMTKVVHYTAAILAMGIGVFGVLSRGYVDEVAFMLFVIAWLLFVPNRLFWIEVVVFYTIILLA